MASNAETIAQNLNLARNSNIHSVVNENRINELFVQYLYNEEDISSSDESGSEEETPSTSRDDQPSTSSSMPTPTQQEVEEASETEEDDGEDADDEDLVVVESSSIQQVREEWPEEVDTETQKVSSFNCGCKFKLADGRTGCIHQFTRERILWYRLEISELSNEEKDCLVKGFLLSQGVSMEETTLQKRVSRRTARKLPRRSYSIDGNTVCRNAFRFILCLGQPRLVAIQKNAELKPREKPLLGGRKYNVRALSADDIFRVVRFIENFQEEQGLHLPGRIPGYKRSDIRLLPAYFTKSRLWRTYKQMATDEGYRVIGHSTFRSLWKTYLPHIVVAKPMTDLCNVCQNNVTRIYRGLQTASSDPAKRELLRAQEHHLNLVQIEREFYNQVVRESKRTAEHQGITSLSHNLPCSREVSMGYCFDFAQQVHLPSSPLQPGPLYFLTPRKCGIFGVCCPAIPQQVNFLIDESMCSGKGSNAVISYLHFFFEKFGLGETEAILHCDNCSGQNKNKYVLWYLMWRVLHGYHKKISLNFMVPGHTKFAPDWCFGLLKQNFRRMEVHCLDDMCRAVSESAGNLNVPQLVGLEDGKTVIVPSYDWQAFLSPYFQPLKGIKSLYHFKFEQGSFNVLARSSVGEEISCRLLKGSNQPPKELPEPIPPPALSPARRQYLFEKIRQFVRDDAKDKLCPE